MEAYTIECVKSESYTPHIWITFNWYLELYITDKIISLSLKNVCLRVLFKELYYLLNMN